MEVNVGAETFLFCPKLGSLRLSALFFSALPRFVCSCGRCIFASREMMHAFLGDNARYIYTVLKANHNRFITYRDWWLPFWKVPWGEIFLPWLLNYHLYLSESWVFRNGLNQWNKKGRCLMAFRWVLKKSLQALQNDGLASCLERWLLAPSHYCPLLTNNMDFPDNSYLAEILFKTEPSFNFFF